MRSMDFVIGSGWVGSSSFAGSETRTARLTPPTEDASNIVDRAGGGIRILQAKMWTVDGITFDNAFLLIATEAIPGASDPTGFVTNDSDSFKAHADKVQGAVRFSKLPIAYLPRTQTSEYCFWDMAITGFLLPTEDNADYSYNTRKRFPFFCKSDSRDLVFYLLFSDPVNNSVVDNLAHGDKVTLTMFYQQVYK